MKTGLNHQPDLFMYIIVVCI